MAVATFGNNIVGAFTGGIPVNAIYAGSTKVWPMSGPGPGPEPGEYYIHWYDIPVSQLSASFSMEGITYTFNDFYPSNYFSGFSGVITESAFARYGWGTGFTSVETNAYSLSSHAFYNCYSCSSYTMDNCEYIGYGAFETASFISSSYLALKSVKFPKCSYIDDRAFCYQEKLSHISFPKCKYVGAQAFMYCDLNNISLPVCSYIGSAAFMHIGVNTINIPVCEYIDIDAFGGTGGNPLSSINLPKCSYIGTGAFANNNNLLSISLPVCEYIGTEAFGQTNIGNVISLWGQPLYLPKCSYIGARAFDGAVYHHVIELPECKYLAEKAFANCTNVYEVNIPKCEHIGSGAFSRCRLSSLILPVCSEIYRYAFSECSRLSVIELHYSGVCYLEDDNAFYSTPIASGSGYIYVPSSLVSVYKVASGWSSLSSVIFSIPS